jgi:hypothetical protein
MPGSLGQAWRLCRNLQQQQQQQQQPAKMLSKFELLHHSKHPEVGWAGLGGDVGTCSSSSSSSSSSSDEWLPNSKKPTLR